MKKVLCACLAMLVLLCGAALAEHFRCELPEGAWLGDTAPLCEGDALLLAGGKAKVKKLYSPKTGKTYDGSIVLADTGGKYVNYRIELARDKELTQQA